MTNTQSACGSVETTVISVRFQTLGMGSAVNQKIQTDLSPATKNAWRLIVAKWGTDIAMLGGVGDKAHGQRKSCHNTLVDAKGKLIEGARALDVTPHGHVGSAAFIKLGNMIADWIWVNVPGATVQIWQNRIRSKAISGGVWRPYHGANRHDHHIHNSIGCNG
jgi:hypothetical protein